MPDKSYFDQIRYKITTDNKLRISSMPFGYDLAEGNLSDNISKRKLKI